VTEKHLIACAKQRQKTW